MRKAALMALIAAGIIVQASVGQDDALKERINAAIESGVATIQRNQAKEGDWRLVEGASKVGMTALCGWALLEGGVPAKDPGLAKATALVRQECLKEARTYCLATAIFFLD